MQALKLCAQKLLLPELHARTLRLDDELISWTEPDLAVFVSQMSKQALVRTIAAHVILHCYQPSACAPMRGNRARRPGIASALAKFKVRSRRRRPTQQMA